MNTSMIFTFFQQNGYVLELSLAIFLFTHWMERRPRYGLRVGLCVGFLLLVSLLWQIIPWQGLWLSSLRCVLFFILGVPCVRLCSAAEVNQAVFYVTAASAAQHMAYKAADLFELGLGMLGPLPVWLGGFVYTAAFVGCLWASAWFFGGRLRQGGGALPLEAPYVPLDTLARRMHREDVSLALFDVGSIGEMAYIPASGTIRFSCSDETASTWQEHAWLDADITLRATGDTPIDFRGHLYAP